MTSDSSDDPTAVELDQPGPLREGVAPVTELGGGGVVGLEVEQVVEVAHGSSFTQPGRVRRIGAPRMRPY